MIDALIARYVESGILNDAAYARQQARGMRSRGLSQQAIQAKLSGKGLSKSDIADALHDIDADSGAENAELDAAVTFARKRGLGTFRRADRRLTGEDARLQAQKDMAKMARGGFSYDLARKALQAAEDEWD